jgi:hypothetical protein
VAHYLTPEEWNPEIVMGVVGIAVIFHNSVDADASLMNMEVARTSETSATILVIDQAPYPRKLVSSLTGTCIEGNSRS